MKHWEVGGWGLFPYHSGPTSCLDDSVPVWERRTLTVTAPPIETSYAGVTIHPGFYYTPTRHHFSGQTLLMFIFNPSSVSSTHHYLRAEPNICNTELHNTASPLWLGPGSCSTPPFTGICWKLMVPWGIRTFHQSCSSQSCKEVCLHHRNRYSLIQSCSSGNF